MNENKSYDIGPTRIKRNFKVDFEIFDRAVGSAIIELDQAVIDAVDDSWRDSFYDLHTPEQIAEHICYNMHINHLYLNRMDGWANQDPINAKMIQWASLDDFNIVATEMTDE